MNELVGTSIELMSGFAEQLPKSREYAQANGVSNVPVFWRVSEGEGPNGRSFQGGSAAGREYLLLPRGGVRSICGEPDVRPAR